MSSNHDWVEEELERCDNECDEGKRLWLSRPPLSKEETKRVMSMKVCDLSSDEMKSMSLCELHHMLLKEAKDEMKNVFSIRKQRKKDEVVFDISKKEKRRIMLKKICDLSSDEMESVSRVDLCSMLLKEARGEVMRLEVVVERLFKDEHDWDVVERRERACKRKEKREKKKEWERKEEELKESVREAYLKLEEERPPGTNLYEELDTSWKEEEEEVMAERKSFMLCKVIVEEAEKRVIREEEELKESVREAYLKLEEERPLRLEPNPREESLRRMNIYIPSEQEWFGMSCEEQCTSQTKTFVLRKVIEEESEKRARKEEEVLKVSVREMYRKLEEERPLRLEPNEDRERARRMSIYKPSEQEMWGMSQWELFTASRKTNLLREMVEEERRERERPTTERYEKEEAERCEKEEVERCEKEETAREEAKMELEKKEVARVKRKAVYEAARESREIRKGVKVEQTRVRRKAAIEKRQEAAKEARKEVAKKKKELTKKNKETAKEAKKEIARVKRKAKREK